VSERGPARARRALSNRGGAIAVRGEPNAARSLAAALEAQTGDAAELTHGFHSYPARMHPAVARTCIAAFSQPGARVLDPFCGSGTVLIEAMCTGRRALGVDLNPIAIRIAAVQTELRGEPELQRFAATARAVTDASLARVRARIKVKAPLSTAERAFYEPHVLLELAGLREEIAAVASEADRRALQVVLSALVVKFSRQRADTSEEHAEKRIRKGLVSEFFERKARELGLRWAALAAAAGKNASVPKLCLGDARELARHVGKSRADLVLSSPPYGGTYDYHAHHARRYPWLDLDARSFEQGEVGARRRLSRAHDGAARWERELDDCVRSIAPRSCCCSGTRRWAMSGSMRASNSCAWPKRADLPGERPPRRRARTFKAGARAGSTWYCSHAMPRPGPNEPGAAFGFEGDPHR
jgi:hypothetical protein